VYFSGSVGKDGKVQVVNNTILYNKMYRPKAR